MFATRLNQKIQEKNSRVCVGLDPRLEWLPPKILGRNKKKYGISFQAAATAVTEFNKEVIDVVAPFAAAVKPQLAFYEQYGSEGLEAFAQTVEYAKSLGLLVIADAKRGDIDSTAQAYANAFLGKTEIFGQLKSSYDVDCMTINPFLGEDSLLPFINTSRQYGKGVFILVKTSNSGSKDLQDLMVDNQTVSQRLAKLVNYYAKSEVDAQGYSDVGAVIGATFPKEAKELRKLMPHSIFLVPGLGTQGGKVAEIVNFFNSDNLGAIINSSRGVTFPKNGQEGSDYLNLIKTAVQTLQKNINQVLKKNNCSSKPIHD